MSGGICCRTPVFSTTLSLTDVTPDPDHAKRSLPTYVAKAQYKDLATISSRKNFLALKCADQLPCISIEKTATIGDHAVTSKTSPLLTLRICEDSVVDITDALNELIRLNKQ